MGKLEASKKPRGQQEGSNLPGLSLASSWPLAALLLASWLLAGFKLPHEDFSRKSVFHKARKISEFSS